VTDAGQGLSIVVVGASGDLASKKIFPALFALYCQGQLPEPCHIFGFARSVYDQDTFRSRIKEHLTCRYVPATACNDRMSEFLSKCHYSGGQYDSADDILTLYQLMGGIEARRATNRLFYLAIPPSVFLDVAKALGASGLVNCGTNDPWSRVVIEKPFGRDRESSDRLTREMARVFSEEQTYRIDHYLGKEIIQNLMVLRFANLVFEPVWNRRFIREVQISWKEDLDIQGRGGYFDAYGIIRDVMQNHLLQMLALIAMEPPAAFDAARTRDEKVKVLGSVPPVSLSELVLGQYTGSTRDGRYCPGYREDKTVAADSFTPTYGAAVLKVENDRWKGVPFLMRAGKGLETRMTEIRLRFRAVPANMFCALGVCPEPNELVIRVQPDEAIHLTITSKVPGMGIVLESRPLDLRYKVAFSQEIPDAYESLLLDVIRGEKSLFIRRDELAAAWDIFTPALHEIERRRIQPEFYPFGSKGPPGAERLASACGTEWR
jgi:glucose-6-phosphate 1-dehydrogenase